MQSLFLSSGEDVTIFSSSFVWIRGMWHAENALNKIIHFHYHFVCISAEFVSTNNAIFFFFFLLTISHSGELGRKTGACCQTRSWLKARLVVVFLPPGTWHPSRLSLALWICLFCNAYPPRRCSCTRFSKRYHCNWLNIWCVYLALTWRHSCERC